jgi:hypothetical protein
MNPSAPRAFWKLVVRSPFCRCAYFFRAAQLPRIKPEVDPPQVRFQTALWHCCLAPARITTIRNGTNPADGCRAICKNQEEKANDFDPASQRHGVCKLV